MNRQYWFLFLALAFFGVALFVYQQEQTLKREEEIKQQSVINQPRQVFTPSPTPTTTPKPVSSKSANKPKDIDCCSPVPTVPDPVRRGDPPPPVRRKN